MRSSIPGMQDYNDESSQDLGPLIYAREHPASYTGPNENSQSIYSSRRAKKDEKIPFTLDVRCSIINSKSMLPSFQFTFGFVLNGFIGGLIFNTINLNPWDKEVGSGFRITKSKIQYKKQDTQTMQRQVKYINLHLFCLPE
jgi:hypothetical protein